MTGRPGRHLPADALLLDKPIETGALFHQRRTSKRRWQTRRCSAGRLLQNYTNSRLDGVIFRLIGTLGPFRPIRQAAFFRATDATNADAFRTTQQRAMRVIDMLAVISGASYFARVCARSAGWRASVNHLTWTPRQRPPSENGPTNLFHLLLDRA